MWWVKNSWLFTIFKIIILVFWFNLHLVIFTILLISHVINADYTVSYFSAFVTVKWEDEVISLEWVS